MRRALALLFALVALPVPAARAADAGTRIIVSRDPGLSGAQRADIRDDAGVALEQTLPLPHAEVVTAPAGDANAALSDLRDDPRVQWAQIDHVRHVEAADAYIGDQWPLQSGFMGVPEAWAAGAQGDGVTVGVVDSGVDVTHPDLVDRLSPATDWKDYVDNDALPQDANGHGTLVAGVIAATHDNGVGISGVAPLATIMPVRVLDANGDGYDSNIASGFQWAADHGARIVNASIGGPGASPAIRAVIAAHPATLFVVSAGNDGTDNDTVPEDPCDAPYGNVICVGATDQHDARASFSNYGHSTVDLFAPGVDMLSTWPVALSWSERTAYATTSGTSMAAPVVAGVAALAVGHAPSVWANAGGADLAAGLRNSVDAVDGLAALSVTGGRIDALRALDATPPPRTLAAPSPTPSPSPASTPAPAAPAPAPAPAATSTPAGTTAAAPPRLRRLQVSAHHRRLAAHVSADAVARIDVRFERRTCAHRRCRYRRVADKNTSALRTTLARRVSRGRYRVTVRLASAAGRGATARRTIRVR